MRAEASEMQSSHLCSDEAHRAHVWFLESMDLVHRAIQGTNDIYQMMRDVLDAVLGIFECDRALLAYPCDPQTTSFRIPMHRCRAGFAPMFEQGIDYPADEDVLTVFRTTRATDRPVPLGTSATLPVPQQLRDNYDVQAALVVAIYPKGDKPYHFVLHQCSYARTFTSEEQRLFQEIGRRLADALTTLIILRDLRQSEARLDEAQRVTHATYSERDIATDLVTTSEEGLRILGLPTGSRTVPLADILARIHPDDRERIAQQAREQQSVARHFDVEYRIIRAEGDVRTVHSRGEVLRDALGKPTRVIGIVQDVTDYKRVEYLMQQVFESSPDGLAIISRDYRYERVNRVYTERWSVVDGPVVGMHVADVLGMDMFESVSKANLDRCFAGEDVKYAGWVTTRFGPAYTSVRCTPLRPNSGAVEAALVVLTDLTQHMRAEEALQKAQAELAHMARVTTLSEIGTSIAHEVNQPLTAIVMSANVGRRYLELEPPEIGEARDALRRIVDDGTRASAIVARIRALLRRGDPVVEPLNLNAVISDTIALVRGELSRHGVAIRTDLGTPTAHVLGDRVQLQQVLVNLLLNAADAMAHVPAERRCLVVRTGQAPDDAAVVEVADTGVGLAPGQSDKIFDAFYSTKEAGLGMGLSISRSIIDSHGGRLWVTPNDGPGVTFHFVLPRHIS